MRAIHFGIVILCTVSVGVLIAYFNSHAANSGYRVAFASVVVFFLLGTVFVTRIRSVR